jgi:hypothetical protein
VLDLPTVPPVEVWDELAEEARRFCDLLEKLKATPVGVPKRSELERAMLRSLEHLQIHAHVLEERVTDALELADELEEQGA